MDPNVDLPPLPDGFSIDNSGNLPDIPEGFSVVAKSEQSPSTSMDVAKSVGSNLAQGALSVPLGFGNLGNSFVAGPQLIGRGVAEGVDKMIGIESQPRGELWQPFYDSGMASKDLGVDYQPQTKWGAASAIPAQVAGSLLTAKGAQMAIPKMMNPQENNSRSLLSNNQSEPLSPQVTAENIRNMASQSYAKADSQGGMLMSHITDEFLDKTKNVLPQTAAGKLVLGETPTTKLVDNLEQLRGQPLTLQAAQEIDSSLTEAMDSLVDPKTGKLTSEGNKYLKIQAALRNTIEGATHNDIVGGKDGFDSWNEGRQLWSTSARMNDVERIITRASQMDNPVTGIKSGFRTMYNNPVRMRGFMPDEVSAIKSAMKTGVVGGALRLAGSRLVPIIAGSTGGGVPGAAVGYGVSEVSRGIGNAMQMKKANNVINTIANRPIIQNNINP